MRAIQNYIVGVGIGLIIAIIIVLILQNTVFKDKKMTIVYVIIFLIFTISGGLLQKSFFTLNASAIPTPQEQIEELDTTVKDNWKNTNGGFTFEQIKKVQTDDEGPTYDDQIINLKCHDFGSYVVFSYKDGQVYQNAVFYKSSNGLILDGIINMHAQMKGIKWFYAYDLNSFKWVDHRNEDVSYKITQNWIVWQKHDNLLSVSRQQTDFLEWNYTFRTNKDKMANYVMQNVSNLTAQNATANFIKFKDVELIGTADKGLVKINSFYNYLYEQIKGENYNSIKLIDSTNCLCLPIPSALQKQFPISPAKKPDYNNADYYGVYRCNIAVNLSYVQGNKQVNSTTKNEDYVDTIKKDDKTKDKVTVEEVKSNYSFSKLNVNFLDTKNSDLSKINLSTKPVEIRFTCDSLKLSKTVIIDSVEKLNNGITVLLNKNATWSYYINSEALIFENFRGSFTVKSDATSLSFSYYYLDNFTVKYTYFKRQ